MSEGTLLYEKLLFENEEKAFQYRLTISDFRDVQYLNVRKYFLTYEGEWLPSSEGATFPATISNIKAMLDGLLEIISAEEAKEEVQEYLYDKYSQLESRIENLYNN